MTKGSLTETQTMASMPCALNAGASSLNRGKCVDEQVGVNAPGSEKTTTFLPEKMSALVTVAQSPLRRIRELTFGMRFPSRLARLWSDTVISWLRFNGDGRMIMAIHR